MTDYFTRFTAVFERVPEEAFRWFTHIETIVDYLELDGEIEDYETLVGRASFDDPQVVGIAAHVRDLGETDCTLLVKNFHEDGFHGIDFEYDHNAKTVQLVSDEVGSVDFAIMLMRRYLEREGLDDALLLEWSHSSSEPHVGGSGGGWAVVTRHWIRYSGSADWILEEYAKRRMLGQNFSTLSEIDNTVAHKFRDKETT